MIWPALKMVVALGFVLAVFFLFSRLLKRSRGIERGLSMDSGIRLLTSRPIAPRKYVSLVEIGGEILALGVSDEQITFLTKIENREFIDRVKASPFSGPAPLSWFYSLPLKAKGLKTGPLRVFHGK
ncbi:MAG: hypothetical protein EHM36_06425 [Deltaproteobacteria bacterium]|nr:MAG: hypothetical protein EHM36_06425 [Deltaproteobacteria bacterium]